MTQRCEISFLAQWIPNATADEWHTDAMPPRTTMAICPTTWIVFPFVRVHFVCPKSFVALAHGQFNNSAMRVHFPSVHAAGLSLSKLMKKKRRRKNKNRRWLNFKPCHAKRNLNSGERWEMRTSDDGDSVNGHKAGVACDATRWVLYPLPMSRAIVLTSNIIRIIVALRPSVQRSHTNIFSSSLGPPHSFQRLI